MSATKAGCLKARDTILRKNPNHYKQIGHLGGSRKVPKGFALMERSKVSAAGQKGGSTSRRTKPYEKN